MRAVSFDEFDAYAEAIENAADLRATMTRRPDQPRWSVRDVVLPSGVHLQTGSEAGGSIVEGATRRDGTVVWMRRAPTECRTNGVLVKPGSALLIPPGGEFCLAETGASQWLSVFVPEEIAASLGVDRVLSDASAGGARPLPPVLDAAREIWSLVERFLAVASADDRIARSEASQRAFGESLLASLSSLLGGPDGRSTRGRGRPPVLDFGRITRAAELIEDMPDVTITLEDMVAASGVSERTLRTDFRRFFGVSPHRYLLMRRLHRARKLLREARHGEVTVGEVATALGMWDLGRFASRYRSLFGELPSETLRRSGTAVG
ncbi:MAG: helix-turn-helix transcriptional regulator [Myxococcota bacterium]|nr:helix-turn-helix transcriptional regulator [Myxococcota bacterium]